MPRAVCRSAIGSVNQKILARMLQKFGFRVVVVSDGQAAVDQVLASAPTASTSTHEPEIPFGLILMDVVCTLHTQLSDHALIFHFSLFVVCVLPQDMPILNGHDATRALRAAGFTQLPVLAVTANAMSDDKQKCLDSGMNAVLSKPYRQELVLDLVVQWLHFYQSAQTPTKLQHSK
jgi:CheY-like chemotaxis protein